MDKSAFLLVESLWVKAQAAAGGTSASTPRPGSQVNTMPDKKVLIITANTALSGAVLRTFQSAYIPVSALTSCAQVQLADKGNISLILLDMDSLGIARISELKHFLAKMRGLPVIALCNMQKTSNSQTVEILATGVNDVIPNAIDMNLLTAKTRAHLRRLGLGGNPTTNDRAANNQNRLNNQ